MADAANLSALIERLHVRCSTAPGNVVVRDERWNPNRPSPRRDSIPTFRSVMGAMLYIMEELMQEPARGS